MLSCCDCFNWDRVIEFDFNEPEPFSLPSPLPRWPQGNGFATGRINLGELEVSKITKFESVWSCTVSKGVTFYKPGEIPDGFYCLGYYCQPNDQPLRGYVLVARGVSASVRTDAGSTDKSTPDLPALRKPLNYSLVWSTDPHYGDCGYFWLPNPPMGYKAMGIVVTSTPQEPELEEVRCVREDLTESCETCELIFSTESNIVITPFQVYCTRPCIRGMFARGVSVGTFVCGTNLDSEEQLDIACLKNLNSSLNGMPNLDQIHALIKHYGPTVYFHPDEEYMPSSVPWFFKNGALLYQEGKLKGEPIDFKGSNLPCGGTNDGAFWIDLPEDDDARKSLKKGNLESTELYVHVKPQEGGTFTDIAMWIFCPFNGPVTLKVGLVSIAMNKIGEHVSDWEHYTLRVCNFTGELWQVYFSEHSGGRWRDAFELEFIKGNKPIVYSSKHGHASFPHPGTYLQGSKKLGVGIRNDTAQSKFSIDSSTKYQIIAAEYLGDSVVTEPRWLQYMREWGPTIVYDSKSEIDKILHLLPFFMRFSVENLIELFPTELYGEEGPTGPKEKDNWVGDERC